MVARRGEFVRVLRVRNTCNVIKLYSSQQAREFDAQATCELGIASHELMARAGRAAAALALQRWPLAQRMVVLCGPGNNGGDGYIVAHLLRAAVRDVAVFQHGVIHAERNPDAFAARSAYLNGGGVMLTADVLTAALVECELVIDALFGIGARPITGALAVIVENLNALNKTVFALARSCART
jgi:ADP-dependent NAD(P)H-hydrate dehydratase / NAD(P)H-hydrate epimerase